MIPRVFLWLLRMVPLPSNDEKKLANSCTIANLKVWSFELCLSWTFMPEAVRVFVDEANWSFQGLLGCETSLLRDFIATRLSFLSLV